MARGRLKTFLMTIECRCTG